jgi:hypothetical protein
MYIFYYAFRHVRYIKMYNKVYEFNNTKTINNLKRKIAF